jgi:hypothetical protein
MAELVHLTVVRNEAEAELLCSLLRTEGIDCDHRPTNFGVGTMDGMPGGPREVVVDAAHLERAQELVDESRKT